MILVNIRVTQAVKGGRVFVQFQSSIMDVLSNMQPLEDLSTVDVDHILNNVIALRRIGKDMFVIKHEEGKFRRVIVQLIGNSSTTAILTHIDYGNTTIGNLHDLIPFSYFPEILEKIPAQVVLEENVYLVPFPILLYSYYRDFMQTLSKNIGNCV